MMTGEELETLVTSNGFQSVSDWKNRLRALDVPDWNIFYKYHFFIRKMIGEAEYDTADIMIRFPGLYPVKIEGLENIGKPKNITTETYADSDRLRIYLPMTGILHDSTKITMTLAFTGMEFRKQYGLFSSFINNPDISTSAYEYWDTARHLLAEIIPSPVDETKIREDKIKGRQYLITTLEFMNIVGATRIVNDDGEVPIAPTV